MLSAQNYCNSRPVFSSSLLYTESKVLSSSFKVTAKYCQQQLPEGLEFLHCHINNSQHFDSMVQLLMTGSQTWTSCVCVKGWENAIATHPLQLEDTSIYLYSPWNICARILRSTPKRDVQDCQQRLSSAFDLLNSLLPKPSKPSIHSCGWQCRCTWD